MEQLKGGKEKRKWCNYSVVLKNRKSNALEKVWWNSVVNLSEPGLVLVGKF